MGGDSEPIADGGKVCRAPKFTGALEHAEDLHNKYVKALEEFVAFQKKNDDKILLWTTIRELLVKAEPKDDINTGDLFEALGMSTTVKNPDPVRTLKWALEIGDAVRQLARGVDVRLVLDYKTINSPPNVPFVRFGREFVYRQAAVTVSAHRLIRYLRTGSMDTSIFSLEGAFELGRADLSSSNPFYMEFKRHTYDEQIRVANRLLSDLDKCQVGCKFLAELFEYRREAIFDPFGFVPPLPIQGDDLGYHDFGILLHDEPFSKLTPNECIERRTVSVIVKHPDELNPYYTEDYRLRLLESDDAAVSLGMHLTSLISQLLPGLGYFYATRINDSEYISAVNAGRKPHPEEVFADFFVGVVSLFTSDDFMQDVIDELVWFGLPKPDWSADTFATYRKSGEISNDALLGFLMTMINGGETFLSAFKYPGSNFATSFKGMLSVLLSFRVFGELGDISRMSDTEQLEAVLSVSTVMNDLASVVALKFKRLGQFVGMAGVALNGISAVFNYVKMAEAFAEGDDAGIGYGMTGVGFTIFMGVGMYATSGAAAGAALATGIWIGVGVVLVVIGTILVFALKDGPFEDWIENTFFGERWNKLEGSDENFYEPRANSEIYGYKEIVTTDGSVEVGEIDFVRQVSGLFSTIRPLNITRMDFGKEERGGKDHWRGHLVVQPNHAQLLADGDIFLRPVEVYDSPPGPPESGIHPFEPISDTCIHRFSLADDTDREDLRSKTNLSVAIPDLTEALEDHGLNWALNAIEKHSEVDFDSGGLDLEIVEVENEKNDDDKTAVTKWEVKIWDMSGNDKDRIFGIPGRKLEGGRRTYFVELIYVPPELTKTIKSGGAVWFRPEDLPSVSRGIEGIRRQDGSLF